MAAAEHFTLKGLELFVVVETQDRAEDVLLGLGCVK
jgi:hypothetical protein